MLSIDYKWYHVMVYALIFFAPSELIVHWIEKMMMLTSHPGLRPIVATWPVHPKMGSTPHRLMLLQVRWYSFQFLMVRHLNLHLQEIFWGPLSITFHKSCIYWCCLRSLGGIYLSRLGLSADDQPTLQEELTEELEEMHAVINKLLQKLPRPCLP